MRAAKLAGALALAIGLLLALPALAGATGPVSITPAAAFGNVALGQTSSLPLSLHFDSGYALFSLSSSDGAFKVSAQSGKKLTAARAAQLVAEAQRIELALGC